MFVYMLHICQYDGKGMFIVTEEVKKTEERK